MSAWPCDKAGVPCPAPRVDFRAQACSADATITDYRRVIYMPRSCPMHKIRRVLSLAVPGTAFLLSGCYTYRLVEEPLVGSVARVRVPVEAAVTGPGSPAGTVALEGLVVSAGDTLALETETRQFAGTFREVLRYDTLRVARDGVASIEVRNFSVVRSVTLGAGIAAGTVALALAALGTEAGEGGEGPGQGGSESFAATFSIVVGTVARLFGR